MLYWFRSSLPLLDRPAPTQGLFRLDEVLHLPIQLEIVLDSN